MPPTTKPLIVALTLSIMTLAGSSCAIAQSAVGADPEVPSDPGSGGDPTSEFRYYFSVTTDPFERRQGRNWSDGLDFDTDVLSRDFVILYQHLTGNYPKPGPHLTMAPGYLEAHLEALVGSVEKYIPDPEFSGVAVLDFEVFRAVWDRTPNDQSNQGPDALDKDFKDDWEDYIRSVDPGFDDLSNAEQEDHLRDTYEAAVKDFFLATLGKCRELRPNAKWGFYGYPVRFYKNRQEAPTNVVSYDDGTHVGSRRNDRLQWMWDAVDIVSPSIYPARVVAGPGEQLCDDQYSAEEDGLFIENMLGEAKRVANGKPVIPFITARYHKRCLQGQDLLEGNLYNQIFAPARLGVEGAALWGDINNAREAAHWQRLLDDRVMPMMKQAVAERRGGGDDEAATNARQDDGKRNDGKRNDGNRAGTHAAAQAGAGRVSTRKSAHLPPVRFNPRTDRISKPHLTLKELRAAKERAKLLPPKKADR